MSQKSYDNSPSLYLIPTPIGNMSDITNRSIETLKLVDVILCEDTRVTNQLLASFGIKKHLISCHDHNEDKIKTMVVEKLKDGKNIGLVTDRGTPIISDPGYKIVEEVIKHQLNVIALPGPTALIPALIASGLNPSPFLFYGFLNAKDTKRLQELESLKKLPFTMIFYEAPHRLRSTLESLSQIFGNRKISISREITKKYEEIYRGFISDILANLDEVKGELVIVVDGNQKIEDYSSLSIIDHVKLYLEDGMTDKEAIKKVALERDIPKSVVYKEYHIGK